MHDQTESLRKFIEVLEHLADGKRVGRLNKASGIDLETAMGLLDGAFIAGEGFRGTTSGIEIHGASITPKGALAVLHWKDELQKRSTAAKLMKCFWWLAGLATATAAQIGVPIVQEWLKKST